MSQIPKICLIGDILVDVTLKTDVSDLKLRLGGIIHAARGLWALNIPYSVGYFAPSYLDEQIVKYLRSHGCLNIYNLGTVSGTPYVFLIGEAKEVGDQGYEFLLRDEIIITNNEDEFKNLTEGQFDDFIFIAGNYDYFSLINRLDGNIHIDVANNVDRIEHLSKLNKRLTSIFVSTSSSIFKEQFDDNFIEFAKLFEKFTKILVLKENRGGSRAINYDIGEITGAMSQPSKIVHSVGVGDVYSVTCATQLKTTALKESMTLSSWIATAYAKTTFPDDFKREVQRILKAAHTGLFEIDGVSLPWELRVNTNIYIAAPDFDFVDTRPIDLLVNSLKYHNFSPRRPIQENGQMEKDPTKSRRRELFTKDMELLDQCTMLIAVLLYNDPGTLIEIGLASAQNKNVLVYDPFGIASNCMLTEVPLLISSDLDEIISKVFTLNSIKNDD